MMEEIADQAGNIMLSWKHSRAAWSKRIFCNDENILANTVTTCGYYLDKVLNFNCLIFSLGQQSMHG